MSSDGPRRWLRPVLGAVVGLALFGIGYFTASPMLASRAEPQFETYYDVLVDGQQVGRVDDPEMAPKVLATILEAASFEQGAPMTPKESVEVSEVRAAAGEPLLDEAKLKAHLATTLTFNTYAVALRVNGNDAVYVPNREMAEGLVSRVEDHFKKQLANSAFSSPGQGRIDEEVRVVAVEVTEQVEIVETAAPPEQISPTPEEAIEAIIRGAKTVRSHTVEEGESLWTIAGHNEATFENLVAANPQITDPAKLQIGDEVNLIAPAPSLTVVSEEIREFDLTIPYSTQTVYDENMWPWETKVKQPGQHGRSHVVERVIRENGVIVEQETISDRVVEAEQDQIIVRGNKKAPDTGTGQFVWPVNGGRISSRFGWRGGRLHGGVDIAAPAGTAIYAADSGVVTAAGTRGLYGRLVTIDHGGGGLVTWYAHMSSINTSVGARVEKGQVIGRVGCTGRCTGPHLHFEVHRGGQRVDPLRYFPGR